MCSFDVPNRYDYADRHNSIAHVYLLLKTTYFKF